MNDYSELKRLAKAANAYAEEDWHTPERLFIAMEKADAEFVSGCSPFSVLALIAENEDARRTGAFWKDEKICADAVIVQLKAENDQLRKDAARYTWLRDEADTAHFEILCLTSLDEWGAYIDAAMSQGANTGG